MLGSNTIVQYGRTSVPALISPVGVVCIRSESSAVAEEFDMQRRRGISRRFFCSAAAASAAAGSVGLLGFADRSNSMNAVAQQATGGQAAIRPYRVSFPDADLADLRRRIEATRWPEKETVADASQGVQLTTSQKVARAWTEYDWRQCEAKLNALPNFVTEIDGVDIHFIQVRSKHENALPLIVTHGWPGSVIEQLKIIDPLTNPTAHGASASDA